MHLSSDLTVKKAAEILAARRVSTQRAVAVTKQADLQDILASLKNQAGEVWNAAPGSSHEAIRNALVGGVAGAGAGGVASMFRKDKKRRTMSDILSGGLLGATVGGAGTLGLRAGQRLMEPKPSEVARQQDADTAAAGKGQMQSALKLYRDAINDPNTPLPEKIMHGLMGTGEAIGGLGGNATVKDVVDTAGGSTRDIANQVLPAGTPGPQGAAQMLPGMGLLDKTLGSGNGTGNTTTDITGTNPGMALGALAGGRAGYLAPEMITRPWSASRLRDMAADDETIKSVFPKGEMSVKRPQQQVQEHGQWRDMGPDEIIKPPKADAPAAPQPKNELPGLFDTPKAPGAAQEPWKPTTREIMKEQKVPVGPELSNIGEKPTLSQRGSYQAMVPGATPASARMLKNLAQKGRFLTSKPVRAGSTAAGMVGGALLGRGLESQFGY